MPTFRTLAASLTCAALLATTILRERLALTRRRRRPDHGYTAETVIVTALLVMAAITIIGIIASKVMDKANSITL